MSNSDLKAFSLNLEIGEALPGGITNTLNLIVSASEGKINGRSIVFQATSPIVHVESEVFGTFDYLCTMEDCHIMINLIGSTGNIGGSLINYKARIILTDDWASGTADYSFLNNGIWTEVTNQKVKATSGNVINDLAKLAESVKG